MKPGFKYFQEEKGRNCSSWKIEYFLGFLRTNLNKNQTFTATQFINLVSNKERGFIKYVPNNLFTCLQKKNFIELVEKGESLLSQKRWRIKNE